MLKPTTRERELQFVGSPQYNALAKLHEGCFQGLSNLKQQTIGNHQFVSQCTQKCQSEKYFFAALTIKTCSCTNQYPTQKTTDSSCNNIQGFLPAGGSGFTGKGLSFFWSVYRTGYTTVSSGSWHIAFLLLIATIFSAYTCMYMKCIDSRHF